MFIHIVLFHLKIGLSTKEISEFEKGLESLKAIDSIRAIYIGTPSETKYRPVVRDDYNYNLTIHFNNIDEHDAYQLDPLHKTFVDKFSAYWQRIEIIDSD